MTNWEKCKLGDVCNTISETYKGDSQEVVLINTSDVLAGKCLNHSKTRNKDLKGQFKKTFQKNDILYSEIRPANKRFAYIDFTPTNYIASTKLMVIRSNGNINSEYLYYILQSKSIVEELQMLAESRSGTFPQITFVELANLSIILPPLDCQIQIVNFLKSIDSKIELNRQINDNLEQQAQAIFNQYFIEDTYLLGDYQKASLLDIADYLNGLAMQKFRPKDNERGILVLKIKELGQGFCDESSDKCSNAIDTQYIVSDGDVIFSWSGTLLVDFWHGGICGLNQHLFKVSSSVYPKWFYYFWTKKHLDSFIRIAKDKAVTMGHIKRGDLAQSEVLIPEQDQDIMSNLSSLLDPMIESIVELGVENRKLQEQRDTLLPKLMSGELNINELDC